MQSTTQSTKTNTAVPAKKFLKQVLGGAAKTEPKQVPGEETSAPVPAPAPTSTASAWGKPKTVSVAVSPGTEGSRTSPSPSPAPTSGKTEVEPADEAQFAPQLDHAATWGAEDPHRPAPSAPVEYRGSAAAASTKASAGSDADVSDLVEASHVRISETFDDMGLKESLLRGIYAYGYEKPSAIQKQAITQVASGRDTLAQAQSGTGKTAAFSIGSLQRLDESVRQVQILIMAPTRELADQIHTVVAALSDYMGIHTHCAVGGRPVMEDVAALCKGVHVVVGTPGRITGLIEKGDLRTNAIKTCILDEADQMLEDNFEEQVRNVCKELPRDVQVCLFSATLPVTVHDISQQFMRDPVRILIKREEVTLDGIKQYYVNCERSENKLPCLFDIYSSLSITQAIIYCNTRRQVDWLKGKMTEQDFAVSEFHAEMTQQARDQVLKEFRTGSTRVLIATDILARGIDVQQVSIVINFDLPFKKESYIHRIGRAGRFGRKGVTINFATNQDIHELQHIQRFYDTQIDELPGDLAKL